jgi:hypothetical protein
MDIVERLNDKHSEKMRFYLSKADEVENEQDRQKVLIQITQNLSSRIKNQNFDLPTIYIPRGKIPVLASSLAHYLALDDKRVPNAIGDVCTDIEKTINLNGMRCYRS